MSIVSVNARNSDVQGLYYSAVQINYDRVKVDPIERMVPVLGHEATGPMKEYVEDLKKRKVPYKLLPLDVQDKDAEAVKAALVPLKLHYMMQILLVRERTRRRVIENTEFTTWSNLNVGYQYTTPLKSKLLSYWTTKYLEEQQQAQSLGSMPSSTANTPHPSTTSREEAASTGSPHAREPASPDHKKTHRPAVYDEDALKRSVAHFEKTLNRLLDHTASPEHPHVAQQSRAAPLQLLRLPAVDSTPLFHNTRTAAPADVSLDEESDMDEL